MSQALMLETALPLALLMGEPSRFSHFESFHRLRQIFDLDAPVTALDGVAAVVTQEFRSDVTALPAFEARWQRDDPFAALLKYYLSQNRFTNDTIFAGLEQSDRDIEVNQRFRYPVFVPDQNRPANAAILLFHGLNEKRWDKYLPWAQTLMQLTGKAVILFPLAFHMNRAPQTWSDPRLMAEVCRERKNLFPQVSESSLANAAVSHRLQFAPQRFILSGLQTFNDVTALAQTIRDGRHPLFAKGAGLDFFAYSIGAFLAEVLLMANPRRLFSKTRLFMFAGGCTLDLADPVSKYILDSEAGGAITRFFARLFEREALYDRDLFFWIRNKSKTIRAFMSMLRQDKMTKLREKRLRRLGERIRVSVSSSDTVFTPESLRRTFTGKRPLLKRAVQVIDFPFSHSHENPFPAKEAFRTEVDAAFLQVMEDAAGWLGKKDKPANDDPSAREAMSK